MVSTIAAAYLRDLDAASRSSCHRNNGATPKLPKVVMPIVASAVTTSASRRMGMGVD